MINKEEKTRIIVTLKKELKESLTELAKEQNRSLNNLIETVLIEYQKNQTKEEN